MIQVLGLATMVGVLAQNSQLDSFLQSLPPASERNSNIILSLLTARVVEEMDKTPDGTIKTASTVLGWASHHSRGVTFLDIIGGYNARSTIRFIKLISEPRARYQFLKAFTKIPAFGWSAILGVMWSHLYRLPSQ